MDERTAAPLIDERVAITAARLVVLGRRDDPAAAARLRADVADDLPAIDAAARAWTGLGQDLPPTTARVVGRLGWVRANLAGLRGAFEPLRERLGPRRVVTSRVLGAQLGALFGLLSTRVLGQFVLPLGSRVPGGASGELLVVGPNVLALAEDRGDLAVDVRRTVLLHEVTHRLQFDGAPWLGPHLQGLLDRYLSNARISGAAITEVAADLPGAVAKVIETGSPQPLIEVVLTPEQLEVMAEAQGLMSLLEGHGNAAMYGATSGLVVDPEGVREHLASRRGDVTAKVLNAIGGMELKRRQYAEGEGFVDEVLARAGIAGLNRAFERPEHLPRGEEIADPDGWLSRVAVSDT
ncbi:zinc-dependent metalloprotease [Nitriliruptor alkaliphilus]|uniref:zinc-dependent metalloprotease n=1 Tax=Nitriliruptor alkaliphilus TaxID=427918 RepID=UPI000697BE55|nr:zinc-dependent metalloprotease [Nitriliruptor alkaliphilus]